VKVLLPSPVVTSSRERIEHLAYHVLSSGALKVDTRADECSIVWYMGDTLRFLLLFP